MLTDYSSQHAANLTWIAGLLYAMTLPRVRQIERAVSHITQVDRDEVEQRVRRVQAECAALMATDRDG